MLGYGWNWWHRPVFRWFYPYYHRRYIFVSLGGYWPLHYRYIRYYWYGCHPYTWYGYYPIARQVGGDTYNYYTYNYCDSDGAGSGSCESTGGLQPVDHTTFADIRERLAQEAAGEPDEVTLADRFFEDAVEAFGTADYDLAADRFAKAMELAPDDVILPFAYAQALFANQEYTEAAEVLRTALAAVSPEKEGIFYPRGLYPKDEILFEQIDHLVEHAGRYGFDADLQLLLGYNLLGIGETDEAVEPLRFASQDLQNAPSAVVLLAVLEKTRTQNLDTE
jgi:tetratricopeptide (TPR) repeat protein